jgi:K+-transporting ATPase KdpF subunit
LHTLKPDGCIHERFDFYWADNIVLYHHLRIGQNLREADGRQIMNTLYLVSGVIVLILFVYLVLALLKPEWFG